MQTADPRAALAALIRDGGEDYASLSRLIGRNPAYLHQFVHRGSPKRLAERDRAMLARYFGVSEAWLGAPEVETRSPSLIAVPRLDAAASAGPGALAGDRRSAAGLGFSESWLRAVRPGRAGGAGLSMIRVAGDSMAPTLIDGDEILVDGDDGADRLRDGIYVLRVAGILYVKRLRRAGEGFAVTSDNPQADPVDLDDPGALTILGRVLWTGRRL